MEDTSKPALYLLCGLLCNHTIWQYQIDGLADIADVRAVAFSGDNRIEAMAVRVLRAAPAYFALAGHSMGARVALEVVRQAPERVQRLALLDTGIHTVRPGEREQRLRLLDLARTQGMRALASQWLPPMLHPAHATLGISGELVEMVARMEIDCFARQIEALLQRPDPAPVLAALNCPVLIGVGAEDRWSPPSQHEQIARRIHHAQLEIFPNAGHMAPFEAPAAVTASLRKWLSYTVA